MNFGFVIDNRTCIGCHACSVACKQENEVPLGVHRTWVKVVDRGLFPYTSRSFQVTRCNHCANPPCVRICPVSAMYKRDDGIVDFDPKACIGCKACLQACPYDAIHIDPNSGTAAKCHYCAHKVEVGLEPACVAVCPEHAIISGDLDDPASEISRLVAAHPVSVRRPEQGTAPKLFYIDGDSVALTPGAAGAGSLAWSDGEARQAAVAAGHQGLGAGGGPLFVGGPRVAEHMVRTTYTVGHKVPWHWPVPAYLVTKAVAAGLPIAWLIAVALAPTDVERSIGASLIVPLTALAFLALTLALLVFDLERPERFLRILTRPQWRSWLTRGAYLLLAFGVALSMWLACALGFLPSSALAPVIAACGVLGVGAAAYTGFLFAQAEGRDLWQSALAPAHLVVQATMAGAGVGAVLVSATIYQASFGIEGLMFTPAETLPPILGILVSLFAIGLVTDVALMYLELATPHSSANAARAAHEILHGRYAPSFRWLSVTAGRLAPLVLVLVAGRSLALQTAGPVYAVTAAVTLALMGLFAYERAFVMAPQEIPNS